MNPTFTAEARTDAELVASARRQEPGAYGELFRRWYDRCYDIALNILRDHEAAADVAQDAFLVGWERLMDLRDPDAFGGWILRTTRNRALNRVTRDRHRAMEPIEAHQDQEGTAQPDLDADPALHAERSDQRRLIWTAVAALGERDASLLDLHLRHGLEPAEIAEELRITPNNASQLLFRLRRRLREAIGAALLWRDGHPTCSDLATLVGKSESFDTQVATKIRRHQRDCNRCLREISRQTNPERLFASVPFAVAPLLLRDRAAAALTQAGIPMAPPVTDVVAAAAPATPGPPQGAGRAVAITGVAAVVLAVVSAVLLWPLRPDRGPSVAGRSVTATPSTGVTVPGPSAGASGAPATSPSGDASGDSTTVPTTAPVMATTAPDAAISHAPRKAIPTWRATPLRTPTERGGGPAPIGTRPGKPPPLGDDRCNHHHDGPWPSPWGCAPCLWWGWDHPERWDHP
jgi:RNA polymerase sigma factor (sigma-70 family)